MDFEKLLAVINEKRSKLDEELRGEGSLGKGRLEEIKEELRKLDDEESELRDRQELVELRSNAMKVASGEIHTTKIETVDEKRSAVEAAEQRGKDLKENRSISVGTMSIVLPKHTGDTINGTFNDVSSLIDRVQHKPLNGGESFEQPYEKPSTKDGDYTEMGADYAEIDTVTDYATIGKTKITAYQEEPEEVIKLPNADYDNLVQTGTGKALRRKISKQILVGDGATGHIVGIFSDKAKAIEASSDLAISEIDADTLDEIIMAYGGDEEVEDEAVLILNKKTLRKFMAIRHSDGKKAYDIKLKGNTGTINDVPFIINSACNPITTAKDGQYMMAYGPLSNYMLATFSDTDIQRSTDYKFKQGMIAHKGNVFVGGNVVAHNGFLRVKKAQA